MIVRATGVRDLEEEVPVKLSVFDIAGDGDFPREEDDSKFFVEYDPEEGVVVPLLEFCSDDFDGAGEIPRDTEGVLGVVFVEGGRELWLIWILLLLLAWKLLSKGFVVVVEEEEFEILLVGSGEGDFPLELSTDLLGVVGVFEGESKGLEEKVAGFLVVFIIGDLVSTMVIVVEGLSKGFEEVVVGDFALGVSNGFVEVGAVTDVFGFGVGVSNGLEEIGLTGWISKGLEDEFVAFGGSKGLEDVEMGISKGLYDIFS